jgi:hypothetical protein
MRTSQLREALGEDTRDLRQRVIGRIAERQKVSTGPLATNGYHSTGNGCVRPKSLNEGPLTQSFCRLSERASDADDHEL